MGFFGDLFKKAEPTKVTVKGSGETFVVQPGVNLMKAAITDVQIEPQDADKIFSKSIVKELLGLAARIIPPSAHCDRAARGATTASKPITHTKKLAINRKRPRGY